MVNGKPVITGGGNYGDVGIDEMDDNGNLIPLTCILQNSRKYYSNRALAQADKSSPEDVP